MTTRNPKEVFLMLLSDARRNTERSAATYREISEMAENPDVKEALEARAFIADKNLETLDECFQMIEEKPVKLNGRLQEVFVEDFKRELAEIQSPAARHLYILAKASHLAHLRFAKNLRSCPQRFFHEPVFQRPPSQYLANMDCGRFFLRYAAEYVDQSVDRNAWSVSMAKSIAQPGVVSTTK